jgi:hypothetical protein
MAVANATRLGQDKTGGTPKIMHFSGFTPLHDGEFTMRLALKMPMAGGIGSVQVRSDAYFEPLNLDFASYYGLEDTTPYVYYDAAGMQLPAEVPKSLREFSTYDYNTTMGSESLVIFRRDRYAGMVKVLIDRLSLNRRMDGSDRRAVIEFDIGRGIFLIREMNGYLNGYSGFSYTEVGGLVAKTDSGRYTIYESDVQFSTLPRRPDQSLKELLLSRIYTEEGSISDLGELEPAYKVQRRKTARLDGGIFVALSHLLTEIGPSMNTADLKTISVYRAAPPRAAP